MATKIMAPNLSEILAFAGTLTMGAPDANAEHILIRQCGTIEAPASAPNTALFTPPARQVCRQSLVDTREGVSATIRGEYARNPADREITQQTTLENPLENIDQGHHAQPANFVPIQTEPAIFKREEDTEEVIAQEATAPKRPYPHLNIVGSRRADIARRFPRNPSTALTGAAQSQKRGNHPYFPGAC